MHAEVLMADNGYANAVLVTTDWLAGRLGDEGLVVAEVDGRLHGDEPRVLTDRAGLQDAGAPRAGPAPHR